MKRGPPEKENKKTVNEQAKIIAIKEGLSWIDSSNLLLFNPETVDKIL